MTTLPKDIQNLIKEKNLDLIKVMQRPDENRRRFYSLHVEERGGEQRDLVLKVFGWGDPSVVDGFEKEVQFLKKVDEGQMNPLRNFVPKFVDSGNGKMPWCLREYADQYIGDICVDFGIKEEFLTTAFKEDFLKFLSSLRDFSSDFKEDEKFFSLSVHGAAWYKRDFGFYRDHVKNLSPVVFKKISKIIEEKEDLLEKEADYLVHGDLYPKNIFWSRGLKVSDWELLHLGVPLFDPCFIWALSWRKPVWQREFLNHFKKELFSREPQFKNLLEVVQLVVLLRFIRHSEVMLNKVLPADKREERKNAEKALQSHVQRLREILDNE